MRLLPTEHRDLLSTLESFGLFKGEFGFRKKSGWFRIDIISREESFDFHRKKITTIVNGTFKDGVQYRMRFDKKIHPADNWEDVLNQFKSWLSNQ